MMEYGLIVRKTPLHVEPQRLDSSAFAFLEVDAYARLCRRGRTRTPRFLPMISSFLGSKTWSVKKSEAAFLQKEGAGKVLFFPDLRNIKYGCLDAFRVEVAAVNQEMAGMGIVYYAAVDCLTARELEAMIESIASTRLEVMAGFGGCKGSRKESAERLMAGVMAKICPERLWCAFWDAAELERSIPALEKEGILRVAAIA